MAIWTTRKSLIRAEYWGDRPAATPRGSGLIDDMGLLFVCSPAGGILAIQGSLTLVDADWRLIVAVAGVKGRFARVHRQCDIGLQRYFAGSLARASRTAPDPVKTPKMPFSIVTM